jgi:hypothetical protein
MLLFGEGRSFPYRPGIRRRAKHLAREYLVDHREAWRVFIVIPGEDPSRQQWRLRKYIKHLSLIGKA